LSGFLTGALEQKIGVIAVFWTDLYLARARKTNRVGLYVAEPREARTKGRMKMNEVVTEVAVRAEGVSSVLKPQSPCQRRRPSALVAFGHRVRRFAMN